MLFGFHLQVNSKGIECDSKKNYLQNWVGYFFDKFDFL